MTSEIDLGDRLERVVSELKRPVPISEGLGLRARARARRRRRGRLAGGGTLFAVAALAIFATQLRGPGTTVTFAITAPTVRSVALVGDFDDWRSDRVQLERGDAGQWQTTLRLRPGRYRFAYIVDRAEWRADARAATAPDDFGRPTSVLTVTGN